MKRYILVFLVVAATVPARAQLFGPESISGAVWGSFIGGLVGNGHCGYSGEGAAIGAGIGLITGAIVGEARRYNGYGYYGPTYSYGPYYNYAPNTYSSPAYYQPTRPNYAVGGTLLGAASGALIGASDGKAGPGAAIGAGAGLVLGSIAEFAARKRTGRPQYSSTTSAMVQPEAFQPVVPRPQYQITSAPVANSTYYWTSPPKTVADAR